MRHLSLHSARGGVCRGLLIRSSARLVTCNGRRVGKKHEARHENLKGYALDATRCAFSRCDRFACFEVRWSSDAPCDCVLVLCCVYGYVFFVLVRCGGGRIRVLTPHNMRYAAPHRSAWRGTARSQQCPCGGMCGGRRTSSIQRAGSQSMTFLCPRATAFSTRISGRGVGRVGPWTDRLAHHHYAHLEHGRHVTTDSMHHINRLPVQTPRRL